MLSKYKYKSCAVVPCFAAESLPHVSLFDFDLCHIEDVHLQGGQQVN